MAYYTYYLRCADGSLYAGIAADLKRRMGEHFSRDPRGAKYTRTHPPLRLCTAWESIDRAEASRLEYRLKQLPKSKKELLVSGTPLSEVFDPSFASVYKPVDWDFLNSCMPPTE